MANVPGNTPFGDRNSSSSLVFEEFVPPSAWTEDSTCHYLLVDLPGFKKEELKLQLHNKTHILVSGERQVKDNKYKRFELRFELPNDGDVANITGKLDGEILYISVPKQVKQEHKETKNEGTQIENLGDEPTQNVDDNFDKDETESRHGDDDLETKGHGESFDEPKRKDSVRDADPFLRIAVEKLRKNKGIVMTAIFAFSLGVLLSQKFQSNGQ